MIAVNFEEWPAELKPELERIDGFISVERFESLYEPGKLLSLSFWRDKEAVAAWRFCCGNGSKKLAARINRTQIPAVYNELTGDFYMRQ